MKIEKVKNNNKLGLSKSSIVHVKETGNITEVKYMVKNNGGIIRKIDKDHYYDVRTGEVKKYKHTTNRKQNKDSIKRTMRNLRDLINTNILNNDNKHKNVLWITLTYRENMTDTKRLYKDFKNFNNRFKKYLLDNNCPLYEYITTAEPQKRGAWHLHIIFIFPKKAPYIKKQLLEDLWGFGYVSINILKDVDNVGVYLTAYLSNLDVSDMVNDKSNKAIIKGARLSMYPTGFRIYRCSKGIMHPVKYKTTEEQIQSQLKNDILTFERTIQIKNESGGIINRINYRHYNRIPNKKSK